MKRVLFARIALVTRAVLALFLSFSTVVPPAGAQGVKSPPPPADAAAKAGTTTGAPRVVDVSVTGDVHVASERILSVVKTKVGDAFDAGIVQGDLRAVNDLGEFADQAPPLIKQQQGGIAVVFRVVENPVVSRIRFEGSKTVSPDTLGALIDTAVGQVFNFRTYQDDVLKINSYYDKIGFGGQIPTHVTDVNIDTSGTLTLTIQEGLNVRRVIVVEKPEADPVLPPRVIMQALATKEGSSYSEAQRGRDVDKLKDLYKQYDLTIAERTVVAGFRSRHAADTHAECC
jgi:outer membrane protein assembly factor BamA